MACCNLFSAILRDCDSNIGGIRKAWIACYDDIKKVSIQGLDENGNEEENAGTEDPNYKKVTGITSNSNSWKEFEFRKQTGSVTTTITKDDASGTLYYESAIVLQFTKQETSKRLTINALAINDIVAIIQDNNGKYWYFGKDFPVSLTEGTAETGTALSDLNGYNITLTDLSKDLPYEVTEEVIKQLNSVNSGS